MMDFTRSLNLDHPPRPVATPPQNHFMNSMLPVARNLITGLEPYTGPWDFQQASHLVRRTLFGASLREINSAISMGLPAAVDKLLNDSGTLPDPPVNIFNDPQDDVPLGQTFVFSEYNANFDDRRTSIIKAWWTGLMLNQEFSLREKMTLFWHNHFVIESEVVRDSRYFYKYHSLIREHALGNFKTLVQRITTDPAMLRYLNGNDNVAGAPNENYARELFELFTIGKGPTIAPGNYTNYTEQDVIAAARVLTGWRDRRRNMDSFFRPNRHDQGDKEFSSSFNQRVISNQDENEYLELIDMIFEQPETARFLCRKLYRWFVYYVIDESTEANVIEPLAQLLITSNYEISPVISTLFKSAHFHDEMQLGAMIKNPIDFTLTLFRQFEVQFPGEQDFVAQYIMWFVYVYFEAARQQMDLGDPPNVAGWAAYYQEPQFFQLWVNSVTVPLRARFTENMAFFGLPYEQFFVYLDPIPVAKATSNPQDPNVIVSEMAGLLVPLKLTPVQLSFLKEALIPGLPDFEWTVEWNDYLTDPNDPCKINAVSTKLRSLVRTIFSLGEYHLS